MIARVSIAILMLKQHIFSSLHHAKGRKKNTCCKQQTLAGSNTPPHKQEMCECLFLKCLFFLMTPIRLDFTHMHQLKWFGADWRKRGR